MVAKLAKQIGLMLVGLLTAGMGIWCVLAVAYSGPRNDIIRICLVAGLAVVSFGTLAALWFRRWRWRAFFLFLTLFVVTWAWWLGIKPSNERDWQPDVAILPYATVEGDMVTVHNIRNFEYRSETDYTPAYYDKRFDLGKLEGVDLVASYWMGPDIAHVFLSFAFEGGDHLAISIETRKEKTEGYSTVKGFFKQYELYYVVADERDVIRLRTNYRDPPEDVYLYRLHAPIESGRRLFLEYMKSINSLKERPEFYNTLTTNCTTVIWLNARANPGHTKFSWKILASGHVPELLYENGRLETYGLSFPELQQRAHINARAQAADEAADFSQRIRSLNPTVKKIDQKRGQGSD